jgi:chaperonin cofactor prefoldin
MEEQELKKIWQGLDTRITTLNERTKNHTIQIKELEKQLKRKNIDIK